MAENNNSKNFAKLAKLEKQIKSGQEKLKNSVKKFAPPMKKVKRGYAHFPARDNEGKLIRLPARRKFEDADQKKEEGSLSVNVEPLIQHDGLSSTIDAKVLKSVDELKFKIEQLKKSTTPDNRNTWEKRKQREIENWANLRQCLFQAEVKTKFANPLNECSKCQNQTVCLIRCQQCAATLCNTCNESMHTVNALHDRQVKIRFHWADIAPLQGADIVDEGKVIVSVAERYPPVFTRCDCGSAHFDFSRRCKVVVITEKGRYDVLLPNVECMDCRKDISPNLEDLIKEAFGLVVQEFMMECISSVRTCCACMII